MKKTIIALVTLCSLAQHSFADANDPVFALIEYEHWATVIGSDSPTLALYEDGTVIFLRKETDNSYAFYTCNINSNHSIMAKVNFKSKQDLKEAYSLSDSTCQNDTVFFWRDKKISVYGDILNSPFWKTCPKELKNLLQEIKSFDCPTAKKWLPEKIEVMFWPYEYAPEESIIWPKDWHDLESESTIKRSKDSYSVYVQSELYPEVIDFLKSRNKKGAVLINGNKMSASIRLPFPKEKQWMK